MIIAEELGRRERGVSFECFPPKTEKGMRNLHSAMGELGKCNPLFVSVTYGAGGGNKDTAARTVLSLKKNFSFTVMPHLTCVGASLDEINEILDTYKASGIEDILALRGDAPSGIEGFDPSKGVFVHASDMIKHIKKDYGFSCAAAVYPEGHFEALSFEDDIVNSVGKMEAGADFSITQMFFDNRYYYDFADRFEKAGNNCPVLPGIMPILNFKKIKELASSSAKVTIPKKLESLMARFDSPGDIKKAGIDYASAQCEDLKKNGVKFFHFFVMNRAESAARIIENAGLI
ncbi:MAG: methylenetetrahydrofolate reductase [NAD(P)H] [Elusimicrobiota bacterium]|nr:methylenetetrahydrofolate reductase [NAD(P)H] [Elusimicrobiota bacterium]